MGQPAYDMSSEVRRRKAPQTQRKVALRVEKGGKRRLSPFQAAMQHALQLISMALLAGFAVSLLWSEAQLVEVNDQIQKAKAELVSEQSQYTYYNSVLNSKTNITSVEEVAGRLGLMKMDQSQLTYIRLDSDSVLVRRESAVHQWTDFLHDGAMTILASVRSARFSGFCRRIPCKTSPPTTSIRASTTASAAATRTSASVRGCGISASARRYFL